MSELNFSDIAKGFYNNIMDKEQELYNYRMKICKECPLWKIDKLFGAICNSKLYIHKNGNVSTTPKAGYIKGCNCVLASKTRLDYKHCIIDK